MTARSFPKEKKIHPSRAFLSPEEILDSMEIPKELKQEFRNDLKSRRFHPLNFLHLYKMVVKHAKNYCLDPDLNLKKSQIMNVASNTRKYCQGILKFWIEIQKEGYEKPKKCTVAFDIKSFQNESVKNLQMPKVFGLSEILCCMILQSEFEVFEEGCEIFVGDDKQNNTLNFPVCDIETLQVNLQEPIDLVELKHVMYSINQKSS